MVADDQKTEIATLSAGSVFGEVSNRFIIFTLVTETTNNNNQLFNNFCF